MRKIVTQEEEQEWIRRYIAGETARNIAKDYPQYNENTISRHIKKKGFSRGKGHIKKYDELKPIIIQEFLSDKNITCTSLSKKYEVFRMMLL